MGSSALRARPSLYHERTTCIQTFRGSLRTAPASGMEREPGVGAGKLRQEPDCTFTGAEYHDVRALTMNEKPLQVKTKTAIAKPAHEVFEAIVDPEKMSHYFISSGSGRMESDKTIHWVFDGGGAGLDVKVQRVVRDRFVSFLWTASGVAARVEIEIVPNGSTTLVKVSESEWPADEKGIARCVEQTQGWTHFLCCMKAYLEHGINLRQSGTVH